MARVERRLDALIAAVAAVTEPLRPQESAQEPDFLTVKEIAAAMRVSERTVLRWQDRGQMPCVRIGGRTLTTKADLVEFIERAQRGEFRTRRRSARNS
jgi:excisionase family DNA binding protein